MVAVAEDLEVVKVDVDTAFLGGEVEKEIYMDQPDVLRKKKIAKDKLLQKAVYAIN